MGSFNSNERVEYKWNLSQNKKILWNIVSNSEDLDLLSKIVKTEDELALYAWIVTNEKQLALMKKIVDNPDKLASFNNIITKNNLRRSEKIIINQYKEKNRNNENQEIKIESKEENILELIDQEYLSQIRQEKRW